MNRYWWQNDFGPWQALNELVGLDGRINRMLDNSARVRSGRYPRVNAWESANGLVLEAEVPGVEPAKLEVAVENMELTIKGARSDANGEDRPFERRFELPYEVDREAVRASCRNGVLTVTLARAPSAARRIISVQAA